MKSPAHSTPSPLLPLDSFASRHCSRCSIGIREHERRHAKIRRIRDGGNRYLRSGVGLKKALILACCISESGASNEEARGRHGRV
ncbi:hypothetical protein BHM03_00061681 [Ensete ventricosum]|nr:hypothetical protein BHM03_00061681 [Ensete ventricosum]